MSKISVSDIDSYKGVCRNAANDDDAFNKFKQNPNYKGILEHVTYEIGLQYLHEIIADGFIDLTKISILKENDQQGSPSICNYPEPFGNISPSTLRYIKVLSDLIKYFGPLDGKNIIEIGIGYGGQCKIINDYFKVKSYTLIDLPEVIALSNKYLSKYQYNNLKFIDGTQLNEKISSDLVISNYAFTECSKPVQDNYLNNIISQGSSGFILGNNISHLFNIDSYNTSYLNNTIRNSVIHEEIPKTFNNNYLLIWK